MTLNFIRNQADALDIAQDTFIRAWRGISRFEGRACFSTWLYRIAHNLCYDRLRAHPPEGSREFDDSRGLPSDAIEANLPNRSDRPDRAMARSELRADISAAIAALSPEHRAVILLKEMEGLSYEEIAATVSCSKGTVMSRLFYARRVLQSLLSSAHGFHHQG